MTIVDKFKIYIGYGGCLGQLDLDQGDCSQRDGHFFALAKMLDLPLDFNDLPLILGYEWMASQHQVSPGIYRRSPNPEYWGYRSNNFSRDQHQVLRIAMACNKDSKRVRQSAWAMIKRFGFHQNTHPGTDAPLNYWKVPDLMTPQEWATIIRGTNCWLAYPLLNVLDLSLWIDLALRKKDNWDQDNMLALNMLFANYKMPTLASKIAIWAYVKTNFMERIKNYYRIENNNGLEPMTELFQIAYNKYIQENL